MTSTAPYRLILIRHGQSESNVDGTFAGWVDVALTDAGRREAAAAGAQLAAAEMLPDRAHTSRLRRAIDTAALTLDSCGRSWAPVRHSWRLNERHYGALQGRSRQDILDRYGDVQLARWRRGANVAPPPIAEEDPWSQVGDAHYTHSPAARVRSESLVDVRRRLLPYWYSAVTPDLRAGRTVLLVSHGNALRVLVQHLEGLDDEVMAALEIPTGRPMTYRLDRTMKPLTDVAPEQRSGRCVSGAARP